VPYGIGMHQHSHFVHECKSTPQTFIHLLAALCSMSQTFVMNEHMANQSH
jgi:hypothetical protein